MNLVSFSVKTKGAGNFVRRLWTVFTRFGFSERRTKKALQTVIDVLKQYNASPTFFIPAIVLSRHPALLREIAREGAEIGIHGYVHNDYRYLSMGEQYKQTSQAISIFQEERLPYSGFRNPYLGWTEETLEVFSALNFIYESNEAVLHEVIDREQLPAGLRDGYEKSLKLFSAIPCNIYSLRPHFEGKLLRLPTSIPDDEMLFDRLRMNAGEIGNIWSKVMQRVYDLGGLYVLNLHPERATLCKPALHQLLSYAHSRTLPVWTACLQDIAQWWKERREFRFHITPLEGQRWQVEVDCSSRATVLARQLVVEDQSPSSWSGTDSRVQLQSFTVRCAQCPCIGLSAQTPWEVADFLQEQGYPVVRSSQEEGEQYALYLDMPQGLGTTQEQAMAVRQSLVEQIEQLEAPLLHLGCWPDGCRAALAITGDIDSVTIQDFFMRILEVQRYA